MASITAIPPESTSSSSSATGKLTVAGVSTRISVATVSTAALPANTLQSSGMPVSLVGNVPPPPWGQEPMEATRRAGTGWPSCPACSSPATSRSTSRRRRRTRWLRSELGGLRALPGVESIVLSRVQDAPRHARPWAWLCELQLADGADAQACVEHPVCRDWLLDLRLLGMRPALAVLDSGERVI